jgi:hypothetical protein
MADLDKTDQAGAIAKPIFIDIGLGEVRCLHGTLIRFRKPRNDTHALSLTLPRVNSSTRCATSASTTTAHAPTAWLEPQRRAVVQGDVFYPAENPNILRQRQPAE